jgi:hypothetical protein
MGYWGWRPLLLMVCISVWVTACNMSSEYAATIPPTKLPPITLTVRLREPTLPPATPFTPPLQTETPAATQIADAGIEAYIVRPGDTLLGIALDFDIDMRLLHDYNPGVNPRSLQVGQQILVPSGVTPSPTLKAVAPLVVDMPNCSVTLVNSLMCLGLIHNTQAYAVGNIRIRLQLIGPQQQVVAEKYTSIHQMLLLPGEAAPFSALFPAEAAPVDYHVTALLESALANPPLQQQVLALVVEDAHQHFASGYFDFSATIHNPTDQSTAPVSLILTLLDANQQVIGYRYATTPTGLAPGERLPVALRVLSQTRQAPAAYRFTYEALPAPQP